MPLELRAITLMVTPESVTAKKNMLISRANADDGSFLLLDFDAAVAMINSTS
jgi:hypothetical protein